MLIVFLFAVFRLGSRVSFSRFRGNSRRARSCCSCASSFWSAFLNVVTLFSSALCFVIKICSAVSFLYTLAPSSCWRCAGWRSSRFLSSSRTFSLLKEALDVVVTLSVPLSTRTPSDNNSCPRCTYRLWNCFAFLMRFVGISSPQRDSLKASTDLVDFYDDVYSSDNSPEV